MMVSFATRRFRMKFVAFFRNVNLGRLHSPNKAQLEAAFLQAGAASAASFLVNGTLVFDTTGGRARARRLLADAHQLLVQQCGLKEPAFLRSVKELAQHVASDPFAQVKPGSVYACCISFLPDGCTVPAEVPRTSSRKDVSLLQVAGADVFSLSYKPGNSPGSPNAYLEKQLGHPASTRVWNTVVRLVAKHGQA